MKFIIKDWNGKVLESHGEFSSFDDAEEKLSEFLGDKYETDRQEYYIGFKFYEILDTENYFEQAEAFYTVCILWHGGQSSKLYELSCRIDFRPGHSWNESDVENENEFFGMFQDKKDDLAFMEQFVEELEHYFEDEEDEENREEGL